MCRAAGTVSRQRPRSPVSFPPSKNGGDGGDSGRGGGRKREKRRWDRPGPAAATAGTGPGPPRPRAEERRVPTGLEPVNRGRRTAPSLGGGRKVAAGRRLPSPGLTGGNSRRSRRTDGSGAPGPGRDRAAPTAEHGAPRCAAPGLQLSRLPGATGGTAPGPPGHAAPSVPGAPRPSPGPGRTRPFPGSSPRRSHRPSNPRRRRRRRSLALSLPAGTVGGSGRD